MKLRQPAQAGTFCSNKTNELHEQIESCLLRKLGSRKLPNVLEQRDKDLVRTIVPHAGFVYSGHVTAHSYFRLAKTSRPRTVVILGPNQTGFGTGRRQ